MAKLLYSDSYFGVFDLLKKELKGVNGDSGTKNLIFCEEKISLMTERVICLSFGGSFFTEVYSFGNYLRVNKKFDKLLTKEGSAMAVRRVLKDLRLKRFKQNKTNLAQKLYELIALLKSSNVSFKQLEEATNNCSGVLKEKLLDIVEVYRGYEQFILENGYDDQSSALSHLPEVLQSKDLKDTNVYFIGYLGFTAQQREIIKTIIKRAKSVTAILTHGDNLFSYINESGEVFKRLCKSIGESVEKVDTVSITGAEQKLIRDYAFNPKAFRMCPKKSDTVYFCAEQSIETEVQRVGETIKKHVLSGKYRYGDFSIALSNLDKYLDYFNEIFARLEIPFFLDVKTVPDAHPLIKLITYYIDVQRKNYSRDVLCSFFKNPLVCSDKNLADDFENYITAQNVDYSAILKPFNPESEGYTPELEEFREYLTQLLHDFNVKELLAKLSVEDKLKEYSVGIKERGEISVSSLNEQVYNHTIKVLDQMHELLDGELDLLEYKNMFLNGVSALELSLIPQYLDAVFIGGYREVALAKSKKTFAVGLTLGVPDVREDTALLSDGDITLLSGFSCLIEPKIRIINHRIRENVALALCSYDEELFLSYPINSADGKNEKSEIINYFEKIFEFKKPQELSGYITKKQAVYDFSKDAGNFIEGIGDFVNASSFYSYVSKTDLAESERLKFLLDSANKEIKFRLDRNLRALVSDVISPTTIEDYYKCPYSAFMSHALGVKRREKGEVDALAVGNLMHEIFCGFVKEVDKIDDINKVNQTFNRLQNELLTKKEYAKFQNNAKTNAFLQETLGECKKFCDKFYNFSKNSSFTTAYTELQFGDGKTYPALLLDNKSVKLKGTIDRVDVYKDFFRIIDYKTGKADGTDKSLYAGVKLQLYLYSAVIKDKKLAGVYYLPVQDRYKSEDKQESLVVGKTLKDLNVVLAQDNTIINTGKSEWFDCEIDGENIKHTVDEKTLSALVEYAIKMSDKAVRDMKEGVIVASPYEKACEYCEYKALCGVAEPNVRKVKAVKSEDIYTALHGGEDA